MGEPRRTANDSPMLPFFLPFLPFLSLALRSEGSGRGMARSTYAFVAIITPVTATTVATRICSELPSEPFTATSRNSQGEQLFGWHELACALPPPFHSFCPHARLSSSASLCSPIHCFPVTPCAHDFFSEVLQAQVVYMKFLCSNCKETQESSAMTKEYKGKNPEALIVCQRNTLSNRWGVKGTCAMTLLIHFT